MNREFWMEHFTGTDNPLVHFIPQASLEANAIQDACRKLAFSFFLVDTGNVHSIPDLLMAFSVGMGMPDGPDGNLNALLDSMRELYWIKVKESGHVLVISHGDAITSLPNGDFSALMAVCEAAIRSWRDGRGAFGERTAPVPFHVVLSGSDSPLAALLRDAREPLCIHREDSSVEIIRTPPAISGQQAFRDAEHLVQNATDPEMVLSFLREHGMDKYASIYAIAGLMRTSVSEAAAFVEESKTWSDRHPSRYREVARRALEAWGLDDDSPFPDEENQR